MKSIQELDTLGIRCFVTYAEQNGKFGVVVYRSKRPAEIKDDKLDWKMVRCGHIPSYRTRAEAEEASIELGNKIYAELFEDYSDLQIRDMLAKELEDKISSIKDVQIKELEDKINQLKGL